MEEADRRTDEHVDEQISDEEEDVDPRVQCELGKMNNAMTDINRLENELDEARTSYKITRTGITNRMDELKQDRQRSIHRSRDYFKIVAEASLAQKEAVKATRQFQFAAGVFKAAKENVSLAENSLFEDTSKATAEISIAYQEALNKALSMVTEAEKEKNVAEDDHKQHAEIYADLDAKRRVLERKLGRSVKRARPYFELKAELDLKLMQQKQNVTDLQMAIKENKKKYNNALRALENISEEIHQVRQEKLWCKVARMPGVGSDTDSMVSGLSELEINSTISESTDFACSDDYDEDSDSDLFDPPETQSACSNETDSVVAIKGQTGLDARRDTLTNCNNLKNDLRDGVNTDNQLSCPSKWCESRRDTLTNSSSACAAISRMRSASGGNQDTGYGTVKLGSSTYTSSAGHITSVDGSIGPGYNTSYDPLNVQAFTPTTNHAETVQDSSLVNLKVASSCSENLTRPKLCNSTIDTHNTCTVAEDRCSVNIPGQASHKTDTGEGVFDEPLVCVTNENFNYGCVDMANVERSSPSGEE